MSSQESPGFSRGEKVKSTNFNDFIAQSHGASASEPHREETGGSKAWPRILTGAAIVTIAAVGFSGFFVSKANSSLAAAEEEAAQVQTEKKKTEEEKTAAQKKAVSNATGYDVSRQEKDDGVASVLFKDAATWKDNNEYIKKRAKIQKEYGFTEDSHFMTVFMPGEKQGAWAVDKSGKKHFAYPKAQSSFEGLKSTVTKVEGNDFSYLTRVSVKSTSAGGQAKRTMIATYTVSKDGKISDVKVYTAATGIAHSN